MGDKLALDRLKDYLAVAVGAVTVFYVCGYLVHVVLYLVLGVELAAQPLDYLRLAGDYSISILISTPQLFTSPSFYFAKLREGPLLYVTVGCVLSGLSLALSVRSALRPRARSAFRALALSITALAFVALASYEISMLHLKNVLQPFDAAVVGGFPPLGEHNGRMEDRVSMVKDAYEDHLVFGRVNPGHDKWVKWFNPLSPARTDEQRSRTYLALLLLNLLLLALVFAQKKILSREGRAVQVAKAEGVVVAVVLVTLFPFVYSTVGRVFMFPVVRLELESPRNGSPKPGAGEAAAAERGMTHPVYLIAQNDGEVIIFDRLNLFQIKHVPRSKLIGIRQLFIASPFDGCQLTQGDFTPCEVTSWKGTSEPISDF